MVRIPFFAKSESAQPLRRAIERTARETGLPADQVAVAMSWFLEHVVDEVSKGRTVSIPSFGAFGAWLVEDRAALARDPSRRCVPKFSPAKGFTQQVRVSAPGSAKSKRQLAQHRRNHAATATGRKGAARTFTGMAAFREAITAQLRE